MGHATSSECHFFRAINRFDTWMVMRMVDEIDWMDGRGNPRGPAFTRIRSTLLDFFFVIQKQECDCVSCDYQCNENDRLFFSRRPIFQVVGYMNLFSFS